jgi:hypothetical protein
MAAALEEISMSGVGVVPRLRSYRAGRSDSSRATSSHRLRGCPMNRRLARWASRQFAPPCSFSAVFSFLFLLFFLSLSFSHSRWSSRSVLPDDDGVAV